MLRTFFECGIDLKGCAMDNSRYFQGMKIMEAGEKYTAHMGKYPVISLSLKSAKQPDYDMAYKSLVDEIAQEFRRHAYAVQGDALDAAMKKKFIRMQSYEGGTHRIRQGPGLLIPVPGGIPWGKGYYPH